MKKYLSGIFLLASSAALISCGSSTSTLGKPSPANDEVTTRETLYEIAGEAVIEAKINVDDMNTEAFSVAPGAVVTVLDETMDGSWIRLGLDADESLDAGTLDIWVSEETFRSLDLSVID